MRNYNSDFQPTDTVGGFVLDSSKGYTDQLQTTFESLQSTFGTSPISDIANIITYRNKEEQYNKKMMEAYVDNIPNDAYYQGHAAKLEQMLKNSNWEMKRESSIANLAPIVGLTAPVLVKSYTESVAKDIVMTEVATQPIVKKAFMRKFLKDKQNNKYYVPEIFYNGKWKGVSEASKGKAMPDTWFPSAGDMPTNKISNFNLLGEAGGSVEKRDTFSADLHIKAVKMDVKDAGGSSTEEIEIPVNVTAKIDDDHVTTFHVVGIGKDSAKTKEEDDIIFYVDWYAGTVSVTSMAGKVKRVQFGGHLSNQNNNEIIEIDREQQNFTWNMEEGTRINTGITIEKIKDMRAIANLDYTTEMVNDMSTMIHSFEDADVIDQVKASFKKWNTHKAGFPLGYDQGFTEQITFKCKPQASQLQMTSEYIESELQHAITRFINTLKNKIKETDLMFVMWGHPECIDLTLAGIEWVMTPETQIGGLQMNYKFGIRTNNGTRIHVVSTLMADKEDGIMLTAYPVSDNVFTFKNWKYSFNIENIYRNPLTPNTPNLMGVSRYKFASLLPVQGNILLQDNKYGAGVV